MGQWYFVVVIDFFINTTFIYSDDDNFPSLGAIEPNPNLASLLNSVQEVMLISFASIIKNS